MKPHEIRERLKVLEHEISILQMEKYVLDCELQSKVPALYSKGDIILWRPIDRSDKIVKIIDLKPRPNRWAYKVSAVLSNGHEYTISEFAYEDDLWTIKEPEQRKYRGSRTSKPKIKLKPKVTPKTLDAKATLALLKSI